MRRHRGHYDVNVMDGGDYSKLSTRHHNTDRLLLSVVYPCDNSYTCIESFAGVQIAFVLFSGCFEGPPCSPLFSAMWSWPTHFDG